MCDLVGNPKDGFSQNEAHLCFIFLFKIDKSVFEQNEVNNVTPVMPSGDRGVYCIKKRSCDGKIGGSVLDAFNKITPTYALFSGRDWVAS